MFRAVLGLACCLLSGCVIEEEEDLSVDTAYVTSANGVSLNGVSLNGVSLNGVSLNGVSLNGVSLNGVSLNGVSLNGVSLNGTSITSLAVGSKWTASLSSGATLPMRIDTASRGTGTNTDVGMYGVSYQTSSGWQRLCGSNADGTAVLALAVSGVWNQQVGVAGGGAYTASSTQFTWACRGKTVAKCVELGYKPWLSRTAQLASCTRMLRADYCGDGTASTIDGQLLNVYDNLGIQTDTELWEKEAEWTPAGARCISLAHSTRYNNLGLPKPSCMKNNTLVTKPTCGLSFSSGAIIINEYSPNR